MASFKFGKTAAAGSEGGSARSRRKPQAEEPQETLEVIRRRAHYRLLGAALLVGITVIGLPMLFDQQPRVVNVDAQVLIPAKGDVAPLQVPIRESLDEREEFVLPSDTPVHVPAPLPDAPPQIVVPEPVPQPVKTANDTRDKERREQQAKTDKKRKEQQAKAEKERKGQQAKVEKERKEQQAKADNERKEQQAKEEKERKEQQAKADKERKEQQAKADKERKEQQAKEEKERRDKEAARARDLLEGKGTQRFVIQIGAFADAKAAQQTRMKAERAGVKTYIQNIKTSAGEERTRVRAGPFTSRQDADKAAATLKGLGLPSAVQAL